MLVGSFVVVVVVVVVDVVVVVVVVVLGECNSTNQTLIHNIETYSVYQFRVQLSPAHSCHCVNIETVGYITLLNQDWCSQPEPITVNRICAAGNTVNMYLSQPVAVLSADVTKNISCRNIFAMQNVTDTAIAHARTFGSCPEHECHFSLQPLPSIISNTM